MQGDERVVVGAGDLDDLFGRLQRGHGDPTHRRVGDWWYRAAQTPEGAVLLECVPLGGGRVRARAWGPGRRWALEQVPWLLGVHDRPEDWAPDDEDLAAAHRRRPVRLGATLLVAEAVAPTVIEQRVTGAEAFRSIRLLTRRHGDPAPGPAGEASHPAHGMHCPPTLEQWLATPSWEHLRAGVDPGRTRAHLRVLERASSLQRLVDRGASGAELERALVSFPGIGPWTAAKLRQRVLGDPDAWSVDDYHVPGFIAAHLGGAGTPAERAAELLEPHRGHRYRVELLLWRRGQPERHGARRSLPTHLPD